MRITINNLDGKGAVDYTSALDASRPLKLHRELNAIATCSFTLVPGNPDLPTPVRNARIFITDDKGAVVFSGYVAREPMLEYAGMSMRGSTYRQVVTAYSDDAILNRQLLSSGFESTNQSVSSLLSRVNTAAGATSLTSSQLLSTVQIGRFIAQAGTGWTENASALANQSRSVYRILNGDLTFQPIGTVVHSLKEENGTLNLAGLETIYERELANDVTVCGEEEPVVYATEFFEGDGTAGTFALSYPPYIPPSNSRTLVAELFNEPALNTALWSVVDSGAHIGLGGGGLRVAGGNNSDGQVFLCTAGPMELGGTLIAEACSVTFKASSNGVVLGFYNGNISLTNCFAGFGVVQDSGTTIFIPILQGEQCGASIPCEEGHLYTLRMRIHTLEPQRVLETYSGFGDGGIKTYGGDLVDAVARISFEVQEIINGVAENPTLLFDGPLSTVPTTCQLVPINSYNLTGSISRLYVRNLGPYWVYSTTYGENERSRRIGAQENAAECEINSAGNLMFYTGYIPAAKEQIRITYRTRGRAVGRAQDADSIVSETKSGLPGTQAWIGKLISPKGRSSADCVNAAKALVYSASSRSAALRGRYVAERRNLDMDVWPGDVLALESTSADLNSLTVVRSVDVVYGNTYPETAMYTISFANDWAESLAIRTSTNVAEDAWLPASLGSPAIDALKQLQVVGLDNSQIQIDAGQTPPDGGGFEVRLRDWGFGPGDDVDLVLRTTSQTFAIPRSHSVERFYIRMYDGTTPPVYSRVSSAVFVNIPLQ